MVFSITLKLMSTKGEKYDMYTDVIKLPFSTSGRQEVRSSRYICTAIILEERASFRSEVMRCYGRILCGGKKYIKF